MDSFVLLGALFLLAIVAVQWLAMGRIRRWKEQILHAVAVLQSNSHEDQAVTRRDTEAMLDQRIGSEFGTLREDLRQVREEIALRKLVGSHAAASTPQIEEVPAPNRRYDEYVAFLQSLDHATAGSRSYLAIHLHRTARTLAAAPGPAATGRALELGAYGYMASALHRVAGYRDVQCAYLGARGQKIPRPVLSRGQEVFRCEYELFDAERDPFPYPDGHFDLVLACEMIEHLVRDPMHMLLECNRVLADGGALVVTTPNVASHSSVAKVLTAASNPQIYSHYPRAETESPHVREYTPQELHDAVAAAGLTVEYLFTEKIEGWDADRWVAGLLRELGLPTALRGEQMYCVARKQGGIPTTRYPGFLYESS